MLRVLVRDVGTTAKKYYLSNTAGQTDATLTGQRSKLRGEENTVVASSWSASRTLNASRVDHVGEKSFLDVPGGTGQIMRTKEIAVEYQDHKDGSSGEYEMHNV